jgi:hypothetical protein
VPSCQRTPGGTGSRVSDRPIARAPALYASGTRARVFSVSNDGIRRAQQHAAREIVGRQRGVRKFRGPAGVVECDEPVEPPARGPSRRMGATQR